MTGDIYEKATSWAKVCNGLQDELEASTLGREHSKAVQELCNYLGELRQTGDFEAMLNAEKALIAQDAEKAMRREPRVSGEMQRMERAERQAAKAVICHEQLTKNTDAYKNSAEYFSALDRHGYPKDSCREFLASQGARLNDCLRQPYNDTEAVIFKARNANMAAMKNLYPSLQAKLLKKQERGVESIRAAQAESKKILSKQTLDR